MLPIIWKGMWCRVEFDITPVVAPSVPRAPAGVVGCKKRKEKKKKKRTVSTFPHSGGLQHQRASFRFLHRPRRLGATLSTCPSLFDVGSGKSDRVGRCSRCSGPFRCGARQAVYSFSVGRAPDRGTLWLVCCAQICLPGAEQAHGADLVYTDGLVRRRAWGWTVGWTCWVEGVRRD